MFYPGYFSLELTDHELDAGKIGDQTHKPININILKMTDQADAAVRSFG
jgi:hypothetical protein